MMKALNAEKSLASGPSKFYISFVLNYRNDEYNGGAKTLFNDLKFLFQQFSCFPLNIEVIVVEWNPPANRPFLKDELKSLQTYIPTDSILRIITVPSYLHKKYKHNTFRSIHFSVASNVGIRRAKGKFVLIKTANVFYPNELIKWLSERKLQKRILYRIARHDVDNKILQEELDVQQDFTSIFKKNVVLKNEHLPQPLLPFKLINLFTNASGDFQLLDKESWFQLRGYQETKDSLAIEVDAIFGYHAYSLGIDEKTLNNFHIYKIAHNQSHAHRVKEQESAYKNFWMKVEKIINNKKYRPNLTFWLRAAFNYTGRFYLGVKKRCYERSLIYFKILSLFSFLIKCKTRNWGLANHQFEECQFTKENHDEVR